jgi:hypothetical protein
MQCNAMQALSASDITQHIAAAPKLQVTQFTNTFSVHFQDLHLDEVPASALVETGEISSFREPRGKGIFYNNKNGDQNNDCF